MLAGMLLLFSPAEAQDTGSGSPEAHYRAAESALAGGDAEQASIELRLALQDDPLHADAHLMLAGILAQEGEQDQAIVGFQRAAMVDPSSPEALHNLGTMLLERLEPERAAQLFESAVALRPDHVPSYNNLAKAYFLAGIPELALASYEEALQLDPTNAVALANRQLLANAAGAVAGVVRNPAPPGPPASVDPGIARDTPVDPEVLALRELVRDLPHVTVESRGGVLSLAGWTSSQRERDLLDRILAFRTDVLDLTTVDSGDPHRMLEVDATLFVVLRLDSQSLGFNFLRLVQFNFEYFNSENNPFGSGLPPQDLTKALAGLGEWGWMLNASVDYDVNIANAVAEEVAVLARPHLTTMNGTPAEFLVGGEIVFQVSGINSGDIKPYPFGTSLSVTPTLLRTPGEDGSPRVHVLVKASRTSVLELLSEVSTNDEVIFDKVEVTSEAVLGLGQTLILSGLNQQESRSGRSGVPVLKSMPILKYAFSTKTTVESNTAVIVLLTPRDPAFVDEQNVQAISEFVSRREEFVAAVQAGDEALRQYRERNPDWYQMAPNRFASHIFLMNHSELYRTVSGEDLATDAMDFDLLGDNQ